jgi:hypothetical protein
MNSQTLCLLAALALATTIPTQGKTTPASTEKVSTPEPGTVLRKAILDALRAEVMADQKREQPNEKFPRTVFTPQHFRVLGDWAFVQATMLPIYGEEGGIVAVLKRVKGSWKVVSCTFADDVPDYDRIAKQVAAPRVLFPKQLKVEE